MALTFFALAPAELSSADKDTDQALAEAWFGEPLQLASLSPFDSYFVLKALLAVGDADAALFLIHTQWGGMMATNATTTWERFDPQFASSGAVSLADDPPVNSMNDRTSMCHPWSSGATPLLSSHGLGLTAAESGFAELDVRPKLLGLPRHGPHRLSWVAGTLPTPRGAAGMAASRLFHLGCVRRSRS